MFDEQKADQVCAILSTESVSLQAALRRVPGTSSAEFYRWLSNPDLPLRENYARARESQADVDADAIADVRQRMLDGDLTPEQARVAIDSLKWSAGKRKPKVYGDRIQQDVDLTVRVQIADPTRQLRAPTQPAPAPALEHTAEACAPVVATLAKPDVA